MIQGLFACIQSPGFCAGPRQDGLRAALEVHVALLCRCLCSTQLLGVEVEGSFNSVSLEGGATRNGHRMRSPRWDPLREMQPVLPAPGALSVKGESGLKILPPALHQAVCKFSRGSSRTATSSHTRSRGATAAAVAGFLVPLSVCANARYQRTRAVTTLLLRALSVALLQGPAAELRPARPLEVPVGVVCALGTSSPTLPASAHASPTGQQQQRANAATPARAHRSTPACESRVSPDERDLAGAAGHLQADDSRRQRRYGQREGGHRAGGGLLSWLPLGSEFRARGSAVRSADAGRRVGHADAV
eukprot:36071-Chlamydomonas_euryale.AAC.4